MALQRRSAALTIKSNGGKLRVLSCNVEIFQPVNNTSGRFNAIWDTGATGTVITSNIVRALGLVATGVTVNHTAGGTINSNTYLVNVGLPNGVVIQGISVTEVPALSGGMDCLIGMDIIGMGDFSITNLGNVTWMSFQIPSIHQIDYTQLNYDSNHKPVVIQQPLSRNDKCHCGSGKKYKHCHGMGR